MSISSEITRITNAIADAYNSVDEKGGTIPSVQNVTNLASAIDSVSSEKPEQSKTATTNNTTIYPDSGYVLSSVVINIPVYNDLS